MRLGGWGSLDMVLRYMRSVRFEQSLSCIEEWSGDCQSDVRHLETLIRHHPNQG
jgi:hypothetical protein